jgi:hypothetical protein
MADPARQYYDGGYDPGVFDYSDAGSAAIYVGVMIATAAVILAVMKKSGFRAMVAVGRS